MPLSWKNSRNSGKPPSSDGYNKKNKTNSLRESGQKPNGGQPGHEGRTLKRSENPDYTETHTPDACENCQTSLEDVVAVGEEERQVYDIPAIRIEVTSHRAEIIICPECGMENTGKFPESVGRGVRYGRGVKTWATYFGNQHHIPLERTTQIFEDLTGHGISEGSLLKASEELSECVRPSTEATVELLRNADVLKVDEIGLRVKGKLHWLHVASADRLTHYNMHEKRGKEAMDAAGILGEFEGTAVHDHWKSYFGYKNCRHGLCNAHHLREFKFIGKQYEQAWAGDMADLLLEIKEEVEKLKPDRDRFGPEQIEDFERRYDEILRRGFADKPFTPPEKKKKGRPKRPPPLNLLIRLRDYKSETLAFMYDFRVPFDNNAAERDVRMMKVKQKISGCFRTFEGAKRFASIRGYISTARKNSKNIFEAILLFPMPQYNKRLSSYFYFITTRMKRDSAADQIIMGTKKGGKDYTFNAAEEHDPNKPAQWWFQESDEGLILFVVFYSQACRWARCLGCNLPSKMSIDHISFDCLINQIDYLFSLPEIVGRYNIIKKMIVSNNGSVLDEATFSSTALMYLLARMKMNFYSLKVLSLESRPEYADTAELEFLTRALHEGETATDLELCIGFEAFDEHIRNDIFDKGLSLHVFEQFVEKIAPYGYHLKCYFMLKPVPGMSDGEAVEDIKQAIDYLDTISEKYSLAINMHLNPTYAAQGTLLGRAFLQGEYTPPYLKDLTQAARFAEGKKISLFLGLSDEGLAEKGGSFIRAGDEKLIKRLEAFNRTQNYTLLRERRA